MRSSISVKKSNLVIPSIGVGCMRIAEMEVQEVRSFIDTAMECNLNFFDHADIYGGGDSERVFSQALYGDKTLRESMILQSKCGIRKGSFDFSKEHILNSVDGILSRLQTDYLDILLLHRPDTLVEPEEVAEAFDILSATGKVRHFGVSNQNPMQIELLKKYVNQPLLFNQLQLSLLRTGMIDAGFHVNMEDPASINRDGSILDYCRLHEITIQAWSPFQYGFFEGVFLNNDKFPELNKIIHALAKEHGVTDTAIVVAWILRHPAGMQTIVGTTKGSRLREISKAAKVHLSREEWYQLYLAAGNILP